MSRSGTLQDALRSVDAFQRAENPGSVKFPARGSCRDSRGSDSDDLSKSERKHRKEKEKEKDGRRRGERRSSKSRKGRSKSSSRRVDEDGSGEDDDCEDEGKVKLRSENKRRHKREHRKKDRHSRSSDKKGDREKGKGSRRSRKSDGRRSGRSQEDSSFSSDDAKSDDSGSSSSENENGSDTSKPEQFAKQVVQEFPEVANDLKQLLQMVDDGQGVDISPLPNKRLISLLQQLFRSLKLDKSKAGIYLLPSGALPTLTRVGLFSGDEAGPALNSDDVYEGPELPSSVSQEAQAPLVDNGKSEFVQKGHVKDAPLGPTKPRVMGPAMPSKEMLEAAAKLEEAEAALRAAEEELEGDPMIGPPPPAAVAEAASANDAERFEEVTRIIAPDVGNAYELLGVKREVTAADLKKRYWKLSLLVHPDKCEHPQAHEAFMALNKAFKDLQDPSKRAVIDHIADEKQAKEEYEADLKARREAAQWRKLRGEEAQPGDAELLMGEAKEPARDEWMTVLPPERQAGRPTQQSTFFSRSEKSGRGDTSIWTDTPLEKAQKAKMQYLEAYKQAALTGPEPDESTFEREKAARAAVMMDQYNEKKRALSMVDKLQRENVKESKKKKGGGGGGGGGAASLLSKEKERKEAEWQEKHPWKPWDREKDLTAGRQAMKWDAKSVQEGLGSRFGSSAGDRKFL
ncbi:hypothetical protein MPTK1_7g10580 [Marchantia polymorpha subsp. ruderalis]|uniref:J domain-containing protein n=2 Tax=Marchantia polymorpha TaxID=3197 RepID=A0A176WLZ9_MARPO|nr:hypothetical protein AXG93_4280s1180 [Marchantia polymorpha subsp. ruderalis]PTQ49177.1 hypothetical protein MARPO_0003s0077 [Marchantia polymorpha]BBN16936.1 hypothetical protein Mp_7g10580 [Marchantia polymorpha subsp. ruderalis]|eukprot:PTQ49177.1 hypothetical protein MARPO_0003s0077 [Marchantia polymorpha]